MQEHSCSSSSTTVIFYKDFIGNCLRVIFCLMCFLTLWKGLRLDVVLKTLSSRVRSPGLTAVGGCGCLTGGSSSMIRIRLITPPVSCHSYTQMRDTVENAINTLVKSFVSLWRTGWRWICFSSPQPDASLRWGATRRFAGQHTGPVCHTSSWRRKENQAASRPGTIYIYPNNVSGCGWTCKRSVIGWRQLSPAGEIGKNVHAYSFRFRRRAKWPFFPRLACRPAMTRGASLGLIWYEIHAEISDRHAGSICRPANRCSPLHCEIRYVASAPNASCGMSVHFPDLKPLTNYTA